MKTLSVVLAVLLHSFFYSSILYANWESHLRKCEGKEGIHSMPEIDFIYMINLQERPEKLEESYRQLRPYGIYPYRFDAINGWKSPKNAFQGLGCPEVFPKMTPGKIACILSHLSVLNDAFLSNYKTIWVMEDDIEVLADPLQLSSLIIALDDLAPDWDILYTDLETKNEFGVRVPCKAILPRPNLIPEPLDFYLRRIPINDTFMEIGMRYGCYSMIIRRSGIEKILEFFKTYRLYLPIDMELFFIKGLKQIVVQNDIVSTRQGIFSDTSYDFFNSTLHIFCTHPSERSKLQPNAF
jgi:GR25 family glycosyltransferase involved in LPS biosynthesis